MTTSTTLELLDRSRHSLLEACQSRDVTDRWQQAQLGALRAAAAVLAARSTAANRPGPRSLWQLLPTVAPELAEWAGFFEVVARRRAQDRPLPREADDLLRQAEVFLDLACRSIGLPIQEQRRGDLLVPTALTPMGAAP